MSSLNAEKIRIATNVLLKGEKSAEMQALRQSINVHVAQPLKTILEARLKDKVEPEVIEQILDDYVKVIGP